MWLRKIEDFSIQETSEILRWSESKVKTTLLRGIKALKLELEKAVEIHEAIYIELHENENGCVVSIKEFYLP